MQRHRILREIIRSYISLKSGNVEDWHLQICTIAGCINNSEARKGHEGECDLIWINLLDLDGCLSDLSPRKKEAIYYHIIRDLKQKDVAAIMGITTVSVGQYVESGLLQVSQKLWPEEYKEAI